MSSAIEKTVVTLGDRLTAEAHGLMRRRQSTPAWLELLKPVIENSRARAESTGRHERYEGVPGKPRPVRVELAEEPAPEEEVEPLPAITREHLRPLVGPEVDLARIHVDKNADAIARQQRAEAVTFGKDVYFRSGAFAPESPSGRGLLAHELTHVAESIRPGAEWRRATPEGVADEEQLARTRGRSAAQPSISPVIARAPAAPPVSPGAGSVQTAPARAAAGSESASLRPMRAADDRPPADEPAPAPHPGPNLETMRRTLFRDLMNQIRVEFERGA